MQEADRRITVWDWLGQKAQDLTLKNKWINKLKTKESGEITSMIEHVSRKCWVQTLVLPKKMWLTGNTTQYNISAHICVDTYVH
jgi:hypothetical protein